MNRESGPPFSDRLIASEHSETGSQPLYEFEHDGKHVVRFSRFRKLDGTTYHSGENVPLEQFETIQQSKELLRELSESYGVPIVAYHEIIGSNDQGEAGVYQVTDKLEGSNLTDTLRDQDANLQPQAVEPVLLNLMSYLSDKHQNGQPMMRDVFDGGQYVFDQKTHEIALIDVDPLIATTETIASRWQQRVVIKNLWLLVDLMDKAEQSLGIHLEKFRKAALTFAESITPTPEEKKRYHEALLLLQSSSKMDSTEKTTKNNWDNI